MDSDIRSSIFFIGVHGSVLSSFDFASFVVEQSSRESTAKSSKWKISPVKIIRLTFFSLEKLRKTL